MEASTEEPSSLFHVVSSECWNVKMDQASDKKSGSYWPAGG